jgi:hypothetical protein
MSSNGGTPQMYAELYKYDGTTFTLISTSSNEILYDGVNLNLYTFAMAVPATTLTLTDRLAVKLYATNSGGKTTTIHTQDGHLCQVITTFSTGITALNGLTAQVQYFQTGTSGTDFNISSTTATHTFNIPDASATARGLITTGTQTIAGTKTFNDATKNNGGIFLQNASSSSLAGYMNLGGLTNGVKFTSGGGVSNTFTLPSATGYTFTFPNATGTIALTSDLTGGTVTSVAMTVPTGLSISGSPITTSGTLAVSLASGYSIPTTSSQATWDTAYNLRITTASLPLVLIGNLISMNQATALQNGFLTATDFQTFRDKQNALTLTTTGTSGAATLVGATLNIPNYAPDLSGYVTLAGTQTITGAKTFSTFTKFDGGVILKNNVSASLAGYVGLSALSFSGNKGINIDFDTYSIGFYFNGTLPYNYTFPNANGTVALTSDIPDVSGYVTLITAQTITGAKTFSAALVGTTASFISTAKVLEVKQSAAGSATYYVFDNTIETTGKKWRFGYTGAVGDASTFSLYNETDNVVNFVAKGGNLGLGVTPSAWSDFKVLEFANGIYLGTYTGGGQTMYLGANNYFNGSDYIYKTSAYATRYQQVSGVHAWYTSTISGTAGNVASFNQSMALLTNGNLLIGTTTDAGYKLDVNGTGRFSGVTYFTGGNIQVLNSNASGYSVTTYASTGTSGRSFDIGVGGSTSAQPNRFYIYDNGADALRFYIESTGAATFSSSVKSNSNIDVWKNGSNSFAIGSYFSLLNTAGTDGMLWQLNASNNIDYWGITSNTATASPVITFTRAGAATFSSSVTAGGEIGISGNASIALNSVAGVSSQQLQYRNNGTNKFQLYLDTSNNSFNIFNSAQSANNFTISSTGAATFSSSVTATSFFESSDSRLKTLIQDNYQTKGIASITPKLYTKNGKVELGYYAQDFVGILDSAVSKGSDDMLSLSYREVLVAKVYALEQEIKELKAKMN